MIVIGLFFTSINTSAKYTPIIPKKNMINPPKKIIDTITEVQPSIPIPYTNFL